METSIVDLAGQSAAATSKAKKPATDIFGDVLAKFLDRIGAGADSEDAAERNFFQATARAPRERVPEAAEAPPPAEAPRPRDEARDDLPPLTAAAVESAREAQHDRAAIGRNGGEDGDTKFHPDATAASRLPSATEAGAAARVPTIVQPKDPALAANPAPAASHPAHAPQGNGGGAQIQVKVTEAPVQAQAATAPGGRAAVVAQDPSAEEPARPAPSANASPQAVAATSGDAGKGGANNGAGSNANSGQPGAGGLPPGIVLANAVAAQPQANVAANASFAASLEDGAVDPAGERVLSVGLPAQAASAAVAASARRAAQPQSAPQLPRLTAMEQIAINIQKAVAQGNDKVTIQLRPEELGRIDVRLEVGKDGQVTAQVRADRQETLDLLQRDVRGLERALQDAGLRADTGSLSFGLRGENGAHGRAADPHAPGAATTDTEPGIEEADAALPAIVRPADGRVDLHV